MHNRVVVALCCEFSVAQHLAMRARLESCSYFDHRQQPGWRMQHLPGGPFDSSRNSYTLQHLWLSQHQRAIHGEQQFWIHEQVLQAVICQLHQWTSADVLHAGSEWGGLQMHLSSNMCLRELRHAVLSVKPESLGGAAGALDQATAVSYHQLSSGSGSHYNADKWRKHHDQN